MQEYNDLMKDLRLIMRNGLYVEDGELYIKCAVKYDIVNLMEREDKLFMSKLKKELEYRND